MWTAILAALRAIFGFLIGRSSSERKAIQYVMSRNDENAKVALALLHEARGDSKYARQEVKRLRDRVAEIEADRERTNVQRAAEKRDCDERIAALQAKLRALGVSIVLALVPLTACSRERYLRVETKPPTVAWACPDTAAHLLALRRDMGG